MGQIHIKKCILGQVGTNCYIVWKEGGTDCVVIDPADDAESILTACAGRGLSIKAILLTHGHFDHILAADGVKKAAACPVFAGEAEKDMLLSPEVNLTSAVGRPCFVKADEYLFDGQEFAAAGMTFRCIFTPGHTSGSVCYYMEKEGLLFCGDTLFEGSIGRTDLPTGSMRALTASIQKKIYALPDETRCFPGHGGETTVGYEKEFGYIGPGAGI